MIQIRDRAYHKNTDIYTMSEIGIPGIVLMERAAYELMQETRKWVAKSDRILAVCGSGNNGGDGVAAARMLYLNGYFCDVLLLCHAGGMTDETKRQLQIAENAGVRVYRMAVDTEEEDPAFPGISSYQAVVDAVFGIGLTREVTGKYYSVISQINALHGNVISADVPSGIDADTGAVLGIAVEADVTVSFGYGKPGLYLYPGASYAGEVLVREIGFVSPCEASADIFAYESLKELPIAERTADSHKGTYGKVLLIAGFDEMSGACCMAAEAAYRCGAGLVRVFSGEDAKRVLQTRMPELMVSSCDKTDWADELQSLVGWADVIAIGPGIGTGEKAKQALEIVLSATEKKTVFDADALNLLAADWQRVPAGAVLTPHPAELSRLLGISVREIKENRIAVLKQHFTRDDIVLVCKDSRTISAYRNRFCINLNGNSGMATGGSGDVLCGVIAALMASGLEPFDAACSAVRIHAEAGDLAAFELSEYSMVASDIIQKLPEVFGKIDKLVEISGLSLMEKIRRNIRV